MVFDANGNATGQLGDASYRWLEQNGGGFSNGTYRLLANERGLISVFSDIAPNSIITTNLDLLGRAVLRGDISVDQYNSYIRDFGLANGDIRNISQSYNNLILDQDTLRSIETNSFGGLAISDNEFVRIVTDSRLLAAAGVAGDVFGLAVTVSEINSHIQSGNNAAAEQAIVEFTAGIAGGAAGAIGTAALAGLLAPEFFSSVAGGIVLLGLAALGGYAGGEVAEDFANALVTELQERLANGESLVIDDIVSIRDQFFADNGLNPNEFRLLAIDGELSVVQECFGPEVPIDMWPLDHEFAPDPNDPFKQYDQEAVRAKIWKKPIRLVRVGDYVVSHDKNGNMVPGYVPRTFQKQRQNLARFPWNRCDPRPRLLSPRQQAS